MDRYISTTIYRALVDRQKGATVRSHVQRTAREAGFKEGWLQNAIAEDPELVIGACRAAGLTDEVWYFWANNISVETGAIDVLLLSDSGRIGIVETKLSYNQEGRRKVLAQILDYAVALPELKRERLPQIPLVGSSRLVEEETLRRRIEEADYLLIIAGEELHSRVVRLSRSLLGRHLVRGWDLAVVEIAVYVQFEPEDKPEYLLVPHLRGALVPEVRQVVTVIVEDERSRIVLDSEPSPQVGGTRTRWTEEDAFAEFDKSPMPFRNAAETFRQLRSRYSNVSIDLGSGQVANLILKYMGHGLIELTSNGYVACRPRRFARALSEELGLEYQKHLQMLFRKSLDGVHPGFQLDPTNDATLLLKILELLENILETANQRR